MVNKFFYRPKLKSHNFVGIKIYLTFKDNNFIELKTYLHI